MKSIENSPIESRRCMVDGDKTISIRKLPEPDQTHENVEELKRNLKENHLRVFTSLSYHENILNPILPFNSNEKFVVVENFEHSLTESFQPADFNEFVRQICKGLNHYHRSGVAFVSIEVSNIVQCAIDGRTIYKIADIGNAIAGGNLMTLSEYMKENVKKFGEILQILLFKPQVLITLNGYDGKNARNLFKKMIGGGNTMDEVMKHPFFWTVHESIMFIVQAVKASEPYFDKKKLYIADDLFKKCRIEVLQKDPYSENLTSWVEKCNPGIFWKNRVPTDLFISLIRHIRHLVSAKQ